MNCGHVVRFQSFGELVFGGASVAWCRGES